MKLSLFITSVVAMSFLAGCDSSNDVAKKRDDLQKTEQKAANDVQDAQVKAVKNVNDAKESAAKNIQKSETDLRKAQQKSSDSVSGATTSASDSVTVTAEECATYAKTKTVKPELRAKYEACSKLKKAHR